MKKIIALLLVLCMLFAFAGCAAPENKDPKPSSVPQDDFEFDFEDEEEEEKKEFPTLSGEDEYVVVRKKGKTFEVKDITEIKNYRVGYVRNSDSELIAMYYCDEENTAGHGTDQDAFSDLLGGNVDIVICRKISVKEESHDVILDPIEMIELK